MAYEVLTMCGRYKRKGDKQKIAETFYVNGGLEEVDLDEDNDCAPGSIQPVVLMNQEGNGSHCHAVGLQAT